MIFCCHCLTIGCCCICGCLASLLVVGAYVAGIASLLGVAAYVAGIASLLVVAAYVAGIASLLHHYFTNGRVLQFHTKEETAQMLKLHDSLWTDAIKQATGNTNSKLDRVRDDIIYCALLVVAMTIACRYLTSCKRMKLSTKQRSMTCKQKFTLCTKITSKYKVIPMPHKQLPNNQCWVAGRVESLTTSHEELQNLMALERGEWQEKIKEHAAQFQEFSQ